MTHLAPGERCADCGSRLKRLGEDVTEELEYIPAHVYTLANGVTSTPAPLGMAHLYFANLNGQGCNSTELYADILASLVVGGSTTRASYWNSCAGASDSAAALAVVRTTPSHSTSPSGA